MKRKGKGATRDLASFAARLRFEEIPAPAVATIKAILLDTLGTALAATTLGAGCAQLAEVGRKLAGTPESTVLGCGYKAGAAVAALVNGGLAHALNYDAIGPEVGHVGIPTLASTLAVAEAVKGVSGRTFLTAAVVAAETTSRISAAQARTGKPPSEKFLAGQLFGYFGAAAAAGHLLGLDAPRMYGAFGIALMQTSGTMQVVVGGDPPAKAVYGAFPNHGGVLAALLSAAGLAGDCDALEGPAGLYEMFYDGDYDEEALTGGLGDEFLFSKAQFKPWPTSGMIHPFIEAARELVASPVAAEEVVSIRLIGNSRLAAWCEPLGERARPMPRSMLEDKFRQCCGHARKPLSAAAIESLIERINRLDLEPNLEPVIALLTP